jgi:hypothetical protein
LTNDLNLQVNSRLSVIAVYLWVLFLLASIYRLEALWGALSMTVLLLSLNWPVYDFFLQKRGLGFAIKAIGMHWLYYIYSGLALIIGTGLHWQQHFRQQIAQRPLFFKKTC